MHTDLQICSRTTLPFCEQIQLKLATSMRSGFSLEFPSEIRGAQLLRGRVQHSQEDTPMACSQTPSLSHVHTECGMGLGVSFKTGK